MNMRKYRNNMMVSKDGYIEVNNIADSTPLKLE